MRREALNYFPRTIDGESDATLMRNHLLDFGSDVSEPRFFVRGTLLRILQLFTRPIRRGKEDSLRDELSLRGSQVERINAGLSRRGCSGRKIAAKLQIAVGSIYLL